MGGGVGCGLLYILVSKTLVKLYLRKSVHGSVGKICQWLIKEKACCSQ